MTCNENERHPLAVLYVEKLVYFQRIALSVLHSLPEAEDAVQEAFCKAWASRDRFGGRSSICTWVTRIVRNECFQRIRTLKKAETVLRDFKYFCSRCSSSDVLDGFAEIALSKLESLPEECRRAVVCYHIEGRNAIEVSRVLNCSVPTVYARIKRGESILRNIVRA